LSQLLFAGQVSSTLELIERKEGSIP
jgi:hypothetical protein